LVIGNLWLYLPKSNQTTMELVIILSCLIAIGFILYIKGYRIGEYIYLPSLIYLISHVTVWSLSSYEYNMFVAKRAVVIEALNSARQRNNNYELASISREVLKLNHELAQKKYQNSVFLAKDFIDDRVEMLQPIR
jgi:hypothetical protein